MFNVPRSHRAFNLYHHGNHLAEAPTDFLKDESTVKKEVSLMAEKIKAVAGIDTQPSFTQSIVSDLCEMHQFDEYIIVFRKSDRIAWV